MRRRRTTDGSGAQEGVWRSRRLAAAAVRLVALGAPLALGTLAARLVVDLFDAGTPRWLVGILALLAATGVSLVCARLGMKLLPLAVLLKMTMLFPDRAPSRIKVARRATSGDELRRRLDDPDATAQETAATLLALVTALGRHDRKTRGHSERVRLYCDLIGAELGLSEADRGRLRWAGLLHDIGKLHVAAAVLNKPGKLDADEWRMVRTHPDAGARLAQPLAEWLGPWFTGIAHHHERFDGTGYPLGLAGDQISLAGRAVSVVDAFETMTAARSYKSPMTTAAARAELTRCAGTHFDPAMVRAFLSIALPRLLWTMGPLTFLVNAPFLRWIPVASERAAHAATAGVGAASNAVGVTAVSVALVAGQSPAMLHAMHAHGHHADGASHHRVTAAPRPATAEPAKSDAARGARPAAVRPAPETSRSAATPADAEPAEAGAPEPTTGPPPAVMQPGDPARAADQPGGPADQAAGPAASAHAHSPTPPDRAEKSGHPSVPPGQATRPTVPPGQANRPTVPPGQATRPTVPPGQGNRPTVPPSQANQPTVPPSQANQPTVPPGPANQPTVPPGQGNENKPSVPPGHAR